jgi:hypothetical protein
LKQAEIGIKTIQGKTISKLALKQGQNVYSILQDLQQGLYLVELMKEGQVIHRGKVAVE